MDSSFNLFPVPITYCPNFISESERLIIFKKLCGLNSSNHNLVGNGKSSYAFYKDILSLLGLKERVSNKFKNYTDSLKMHPVKIVESWFNIQQKGGYLLEHNHGTPAVSSALYINVDDRSSNLTFKNPNPLVCSLWNPSTVRKFNYSEHVIKPKNGDMYIFPGWLNHGSTNINGTENRMVISANAAWNVSKIKDKNKVNLSYQ